MIDTFTVSASKVTTGQTHLERAWLTVRRHQMLRPIPAASAKPMNE